MAVFLLCGRRSKEERAEVNQTDAWVSSPNPGSFRMRIPNPTKSPSKSGLSHSLPRPPPLVAHAAQHRRLPQCVVNPIPRVREGVSLCMLRAAAAGSAAQAGGGGGWSGKTLGACRAGGICGHELMEGPESDSPGG